MVKKRYIKGFTLIELLVVVLIIGILVAVALPQYQKAVARARITQLLVRFDALKKASNFYFLTEGVWPTDVRKLEIGLFEPGVRYGFADWLTGNKEHTALIYKNGDQCAVWSWSPSVIACKQKDVIIQCYGQLPTFQTCVCAALTNMGEQFCYEMSRTKTIIYDYGDGRHQYQIDPL